MHDFKGEFKIGFEIHQRLDTSKLFCNCPSEEGIKEGPKVKRRLRPVASEKGELDRAAIQEYLSGRYYEYIPFQESTCLVELDEEPPREVNGDALHVCLQIAKLFNAKPVDEIHVMRKIVIDGSNTTGFQRTMLVAEDGHLDMGFAKVSIPTIYLEEESAGIVGKGERKSVYRLDRLGIPLVELSTGVIENITPEQAREVALRIGKLLRATGRVKRGLGTIRQDVNVSVPGGARVEIKGVQDVYALPELIKREIQRQKTLIELSRTLKEKGLESPNHTHELFDVTSIFKESQCRFLKNAKSVFAIKLPGFSGLLGIQVQPGRRVGTEISDYSKKAGVGGIIHSDENLNKYKISSTELEALKDELGVSKEDAFILVASDPEKARLALRLALERVSMLFQGVPSEVRKALPDANSSYMRPMPGAARMYPETDVPTVLITNEIWDSISLPELPEETLARLKEEGVPGEMARLLVDSGDFVLFDTIVRETEADPKLVASTLVSTRKALSRDGVDVDRLTTSMWVSLFKADIPKEALPEAIKALAESGDVAVLKRFVALSEEDVRAKVRGVIGKIAGLESKRNPFAVAMGEVMKELRGSADGKLISRLVREELDRIGIGGRGNKE